MASDPYVSDVAIIEDMDGTPVDIGVDYDTVTLGDTRRLTLAQAEEFAQAFVRACWLAGANAERMRQEAHDGL